MRQGTKTKFRNEDAIREMLMLVRNVSNGCIESWHAFLLKYSGLIYSVARRHLPSENEDDVRSVCVEIIKRLYESDLAKYKGQAQLSTWLFVYVKRRALDYWRSKHGRYREPAGLSRLKDIDREVLSLYYIDRMRLEIVVQSLNWNGQKITTDDVIESILRIENTLDRRYLRRLDNEHQARLSRSASISMMKFLCHLRIELEMQNVGKMPDYTIMKQEADNLADRIRAQVANLSDMEKRIIELRFNQQKTAKEISGILKIEEPRKIYTIVDKIINKLRGSL
ncbi:MAG: sigma-70 family RNA polymerase sigma factor [Planctomycetota bacterium]|jgi:RNA polymerase sigma factor (sigma-70 family)